MVGLVTQFLVHVPPSLPRHAGYHRHRAGAAQRPIAIEDDAHSDARGSPGEVDGAATTGGAPGVPIAAGALSMCKTGFSSVTISGKPSAEANASASTAITVSAAR